MPISLFNIQPFLPAIEARALLLTPNSRLKNKLLAAYNRHCHSLGQHSWPAPRVYALAEWLDETHQQLLDRALLPQPFSLAGDFVQQQLWLDIVRSDSLGAELINPHRLASDAQAAYRSLQRWRLGTDAIGGAESEERWPLIRWADEFERRLAERRLCTREQLQHFLLELYQQAQLSREQQLVLIGFDDIPPLSSALFDGLAESVERQPAHRGQPAPDAQLLACAGQDDEIRAAACWARQILAAEPAASIGIIAPNLGQIRGLVEQVFVEVLEPQFMLPETARYTLPFNFSAGIPLGSVALVQDTLALLQLNHYASPVEALTDLFYSPFWGAAECPLANQKLALWLRQVQRARIKHSNLRQRVHRWVEKPVENAEESLQQHWQWLDQSLQQFESLRRQQPRKLLPSQWLELFERQLRLLGWPGSRRLDSNEFQQMNQWYQLLESFCQLDSLGQPLTCSETLDLLAQLAGREHYQAQTPESPIQILGILEGAGLQFSHCWVMGMSQQSWPPAPEPNPLLPLSLQREQGMPHADADRELAFAEQLTDNYRRCAPQLVFSHPRQDGETPLQPSALLQDLVPSEVETDSQPQGWIAYQQLLLQRRQWQWLNTGSAPPVSAAEIPLLRGGSQILRNQAIAPAAAFLLHRLGAERQEPIASGFTSMERGQILHDALSELWTELRDQQRLLDLDEDALGLLVSAAIGRQLQPFGRREPEIFGATYLQLEQERQQQLILRWLAQEKQRPAFSVLANEELIEARFAGLPLRLRLDRLDRLASGELVLVDYKTGTPSARQWGGERPEEPQLPLYCLCYQADIDAIMFVQLNAKDVTIKGLGNLSVSHPGILAAAEAGELELPTDWNEIREHWRSRLQSLAEEFLQGDCWPEFKSPALKRYYQHLAPILRWAESKDILPLLHRQPAVTEGGPEL